jgi:hypothetical protein
LKWHSLSEIRFGRAKRQTEPDFRSFRFILKWKNVLRDNFLQDLEDIAERLSVQTKELKEAVKHRDLAKQDYDEVHFFHEHNKYVSARPKFLNISK